MALHGSRGSGDTERAISMQNVGTPSVNLTPTMSSNTNGISGRSSRSLDRSLDYVIPSSQSVMSLAPYGQDEISQEEMDVQSQYMQMQQQSRQRAKEQLGALLLTYPAVLSIGTSRPKASYFLYPFISSIILHIYLITTCNHCPLQLNELRSYYRPFHQSNY